MKKIILSFIIFISFFSLSVGLEANIKVGYDFYRRESNYYNNTPRSFVLGVELLPLTFKDERIKLGVGVETDFRRSYKGYIKYHRYSWDIMIPLYATAKFTYYRPKNIDLNLYTFARFGYVFAVETPSKNGRSLGYGIKNTSGLYYGLGLGLDYKHFLAEILYDGKHRMEFYSARNFPKMDSEMKVRHYFDHKLGIRLGMQIGTQHFKKAQIEPKVVERIVEVPKIVEKKITSEIIIKNFDISTEVLFEFNKYELQDIKGNGKQEIEKKVKELLKSGFEITEINVVGHSDRIETEDKLGLNRADTIKEYLKDLGIKVEIKASSKGKTNPKVHCNNFSSPDKSKECLQPNRRVEVQFLGFETQKKVEEVIEKSK